MKKQIANILTIIRIVLSISLVFCIPFGHFFFIIYTICGLTDMVDGTVARMTHSDSAFGARLDSIADTMFVIAVLSRLIPYIYDFVPKYIYILIIIVALIKILSLIIGYVRFHHFSSPHTVLNKITGLVLFVVPYVFFLYRGGILYLTVSVIALMAALEEMLCQLYLKQENQNIKSIWRLIQNK